MLNISKLAATSISYALCVYLCINIQPASANDLYNSFSCASGELVNGMQLRSESGGWEGSATRMIDNNPYTGWSTNANTPSTATYSLGQSASVSQISLYVSQYHPSTGSVAVDVLRENDVVAQTINVNVSEQGWNTATLNQADISAVRLQSNVDTNLFEMRACSKPVVNSNCTLADYSAFSVPQKCMPSAMQGVEESMRFGSWRDSIDGGTLGTSTINSGLDCRDLHDQYFVIGDDGMAYHTWHPPVKDGCEFRHEHGDDAKNSNIFNYAEGYPPFGYAAAQQGGHAGTRVEGHFGHKVVVANDVRLGVGNPQNDGETNIRSAGIVCQWFSKLHQGAFSTDAVSNHLHEYFLNLQCQNDGLPRLDSYTPNPGANDIQFAVKGLVQWGLPNTIEILGVKFPGGIKQLDDTPSQVISALALPWNGNISPVNPAQPADPGDGSGGMREFEDIHSRRWLSWDYPSAMKQPELWSGNSGMPSIYIPDGGSLRFAPYYVVKNPIRLLQPDYISKLGLNDEGPSTEQNVSYIVKPTVEWCYTDDSPRMRIENRFCSILPETYPGPDYWKSADSPFNATVRAVNFKEIAYKNQAGPVVWCTDSFGNDPSYANSEGQCPGKVLQRGNSRDNSHWNNFLSTGQNVNSSLERWEFGYDENTSTWIADRKTPNPDADGDYSSSGIGFEWIVNHGNAQGVRSPN